MRSAVPNVGDLRLLSLMYHCRRHHHVLLLQGSREHLAVTGRPGMDSTMPADLKCLCGRRTRIRLESGNGALRVGLSPCAPARTPTP
jgi:hypothetical protein